MKNTNPWDALNKKKKEMPRQKFGTGKFGDARVGNRRPGARGK
jgi:hypothetical protein